ncbi:hypothetical protein HI914_02094 [Erysiphe necator]|nr:hypothetical protein HI914_02094 [Erysiphe necator]
MRPEFDTGTQENNVNYNDFTNIYPSTKNMKRVLISQSEVENILHELMKNESRRGKLRLQSVAEEEEEILLVEATSSSAGTRNFSAPTQSRFEESYPINCNSVTSNQFPQDRAFRVLGEVLLSRDGMPGRIYLNNSMVCADQGSDLVLISPQLVRILRLEKNTLSSPQNQVINMGTADGASHRITERVSFVFVSGGITRHVHAFVRPDKGMINDLFLLLGLPWLQIVKAVINIVDSASSSDDDNGSGGGIIFPPTSSNPSHLCCSFWTWRLCRLS